MKLPKGWRVLRGRYFYRVPRGQEHFWDGKQTFKLGDTKEEAYRVWFERTGWITEGTPTDMNSVFDAFWLEYVTTHLAPGTHESYHYGIEALRKAFGHMHPAAIKPMHVYAYLDKRSKKVAGNREAAILSSSLTFCVEKGWIEANVIKGQITRRGKRTERPRKRVPTREEIEAFTEICPEWMKGYIALKMITGLRQGQLLAINLTEHWDGRYLTPPTSKGGRVTRYGGDGLKRVIQTICGNRLLVGYAFINTRGTRITPSAFKSAWRRSIKRFEARGGERFNEHDIRKYVASEADTLEHAQRLLGHTDSKVTAQVYRVGPQDVEVLK